MAKFLPKQIWLTWVYMALIFCLMIGLTVYARNHPYDKPESGKVVKP